jgi:predicted enzyme related to lactoylglutathione lyase
MKVQFVAGFGPIVRDLERSARFYREALGLPLPKAAMPNPMRAVIASSAAGT